MPALSAGRSSAGIKIRSMPLPFVSWSFEVLYAYEAPNGPPARLVLAGPDWYLLTGDEYRQLRLAADGRVAACSVFPCSGDQFARTLRAGASPMRSHGSSACTRAHSPARLDHRSGPDVRAGDPRCAGPAAANRARTPGRPACCMQASGKQRLNRVPSPPSLAQCVFGYWSS